MTLKWLEWNTVKVKNEYYDIDGNLVKTEYVEIPDTPEPETPVDEQADMQEMLVDMDYRITLLELGITE